MRCPDLVLEFEKNRMVQVLSECVDWCWLCFDERIYLKIMFHFYFKLIDVDGAIMYIMQTKKNTVEIIPSIEAKIFWPKLIARFLESCVEWRMPPPVTNHIFDEIIEAEPQNVGPNRIQCEYLHYLYFSFYSRCSETHGQHILFGRLREHCHPFNFLFHLKIDSSIRMWSMWASDWCESIFEDRRKNWRL